MVRILSVEALPRYRLRLGLTDGRTIERDLTLDLRGPVFWPLQDPAFFAQVRVDDGTVVWPNGADLDPDVLIWGVDANGCLLAPPPSEALANEQRLTLIYSSAENLVDRLFEALQAAQLSPLGSYPAFSTSAASAQMESYAR